MAVAYTLRMSPDANREVAHGERGWEDAVSHCYFDARTGRGNARPISVARPTCNRRSSHISVANAAARESNTARMMPGIPGSVRSTTTANAVPAADAVTMTSHGTVSP